MPTLDTLELDIEQIRERIAAIDANPLPEGARPLRQDAALRTREYWEQLLAQREAELEAKKKAEREAAQREVKRKAKAHDAAIARAREIEPALHEAARQFFEAMGAVDALIAASEFGSAVAAYDKYHRLYRAREVARMDAPELVEMRELEPPALQFAPLLALLLHTVREPVGGAHRPRLRLM